MKNLILTIVSILTLGTSYAQKVSWTYTIQSEKWVKGKSQTLKVSDGKADITIYPNDKLQKMDGFGACFNEQGWEALQSVSKDVRTI